MFEHLVLAAGAILEVMESLGGRATLEEGDG